MGAEQPSDPPETTGTLRRWAGVVGFALRRLFARSRHTASREFLSTLCLVALAIALLIVVSGISLTLADESTVESEAADLRVVPAEQSSLSPIVDAGQPRVHDVHARTAQISSHERVTAATPVLIEGVRLRAPDSSQPVEVLAIGVIPGPASPPVAGLATSRLGDGDPHYANGSYDGRYTGDVLLSAAAAEQLNATTDDPLLLQSQTAGPSNEEYTVTAIDAGAQPSSSLPIAVFRLSELQAVSGAAKDDRANQIVVQTAGDGTTVRHDLDAMDANTTVVSNDGVAANVNALQDNQLAMALSVTTSLLGIALCALVVATTMGLTINADRQHLAVLAALGFNRRARLTLVAVTVLGLTIAGAAIGLLLGVSGVVLTNAVAQATLTTAPIATVGLWTIPYAFGVALIAGILAVPYPLAIAARTSILAELQQ